MRLEEAIKQTKPFKDDYSKLGVNLMYTSNWFTGNLKSHFKKFGLTVKQYNILRILQGAQVPVSTSFIRERLLDKMSDVSRIVDRMEEKGLVQKNACQNDKRLIDVLLTKEGKKMLNTVSNKMNIVHELLANLKPKEVSQLNELLDKLRSQ